jgi:hypothetical protein
MLQGKHFFTRSILPLPQLSCTHLTRDVKSRLQLWIMAKQPQRKNNMENVTKTKESWKDIHKELSEFAQEVMIRKNFHVGDRDLSLDPSNDPLQEPAP